MELTTTKQDAIQENTMSENKNINQQDSNMTDPLDVHIGRRLRQRRQLLGLTQKDIAEHLGIKYQQIQKYERGYNRIASSTLYNIARVLQIPVDFFFHDMSEEAEHKENTANIGFAEGDQAPFEGEDPMLKRETMNLIRAYYSIDDPKKRKHIYDLIRSMAEMKDSE